MNKFYEVLGYIGIALTVIGQIVINISPVGGQIIWFFANICFLVKAIKQKMGRAETIRNVIMLSITTGLIILCLIGVF